VAKKNDNIGDFKKLTTWGAEVGLRDSILVSFTPHLWRRYAAMHTDILNEQHENDLSWLRQRRNG